MINQLVHNPQTMILLAIMAFLGLVTTIFPSVSVIMWFLVVFALLCFRWPLYSFFFVVIVSFFNNINLIYLSPVRITAERYGLGAVPLVVLLTVVLLKIVVNNQHCFIEQTTGKGKLTRKILSYDYLILLFFLWSAITILWSIDLYHGYNAIFNLFSGCSLYFLALYFLDDTQKMELFFKVVFIAIILLMGVFMISNKIDITNFIYRITRDLSIECSLITYGKRPGGFAPPQIAGNIFIFAFFLGCCLFAKAKLMVKYLLLALSMLFCSAIFSSGSKATAGSFMISVLFFIVIYPPLRRRLVWLMPVTFFAFIGVFILNALVLGADRMARGGEMNEMSLTYRLEFWKVGFEMLRENCMGAGIGGFAKLVDPWPGAHSFYFGILFDVGVVGWFILLTYLVGISCRIQSFWLKGIDSDLRLYGYCFFAFWVAFFVHATVDLAYFLPHLWLYLGVSSALLKIMEKSCPPAPYPFLSDRLAVQNNTMKPSPYSSL